MGLARIDDALELGVRQQAVGDDGRRQTWQITGLGRGDRSHRGRLYEPCRMCRRSGNTDRLKSVSFIKRLGDAPAFRWRPVDGLVGKLDRGGFDNRRGGPAWRSSVGRRPYGYCPRSDRRGSVCDGGDHRYGGPRRDEPRNPVEQCRRVVRRPRRRRELRRIIRRHAVDDCQARLNARAVPGIDPTIDSRRKHHTPAFLQSDEAVAPGWIVGGKAGARNGDQAAAFGETLQRGREMSKRGVRDAAVDMGSDREGRVHQHDGRMHGGVEVVVDVGCVVLGDADPGKQAVEQMRARFGEFVEDQEAACELGVDGEQARPGRGLQHEVGRRDRGADAGRETETDRGRELLERLALLGPARVGRKQIRHLGQHGKEHRW